jgi:uncharacterized membrane protein
MSEPAQQTTTRNRPSIPFIVSLCLNVALVAMIGVVIAASILQPPHSPWSAGPLGPRALIAAAEPAERTKIEAIVAAHQSRIRDLTRQAAQARMAAFGVFARPQFVASDYMNALDRVRVSNDALQSEVSKLMVEASAVLSSQERAVLAEKIREHRKPMWRAFRRIGW